MVQPEEWKEKTLNITLLLIEWKETPERPGCLVEEMGLALPLHPPGEVYKKQKLKGRNTAAGPIIIYTLIMVPLSQRRTFPIRY